MIRARRGEDGQELVEYALILPLLLLILFGISEFAIVVFSYDTIANAAREGARFGAIGANAVNANGVTQTCVAPTNPIVQRSCRLISGLDPAGVRVTPSLPGSGTVRVTVSYDTSFISGPVIQAVGGAAAMRLNAVANMQIE